MEVWIQADQGSHIHKRSTLTAGTGRQIPDLACRVAEDGLGHGPVLLLDLEQVHLVRQLALQALRPHQELDLVRLGLHGA